MDRVQSNCVNMAVRFDFENELDPWQNTFIAVDLINGVQHHFRSLFKKWYYS